jgi:hypothetical protein
MSALPTDVVWSAATIQEDAAQNTAVCQAVRLPVVVPGVQPRASNICQTREDLNDVPFIRNNSSALPSSISQRR